MAESKWGQSRITRQSEQNGWPTGGERFQEPIEAAMARNVMPGRRGRPRKLAMETVEVNE